MSIEDEREDWVLDPRGLINSVNLIFAAKFFWLLVRHLLSLTTVVNILTCYRTVLVVALVAWLDINFAKLLISVIHQRAFKSSFTYPFSCIIFHLCRDEGVSSLLLPG